MSETAVSGAIPVSGAAASAGGDIRRLSDSDFLAERARVRETIAALTERLAELDEEFLRRASAAWTAAVQ